MSDIQARIKIKKSTVAGEVPLPADLEVSELALNLADKKLYSKDANNTVFPVFGSQNLDLVYAPVPYRRSIGAFAGGDEGVTPSTTIDVEYPPTIAPDDIIVLCITVRGNAQPEFEGKGTTWEVAKEGVFEGSMCPNMSSGDLQGPQEMYIYSLKAGQAPPSGTVTVGFTPGDENNNMLSGVMFAVGASSGIMGVARNLEDGATCSVEATYYPSSRFSASVFTYVFRNGDNDSAYRVASGASGLYSPGYATKMAVFTAYYANAANTTHYIDNTNTLYTNNHCGAIITFAPSLGISFDDLFVQSVQGKGGNVRLDLSEMDDVSLNVQPGQTWSTPVVVTPTLDGQWRPNLNTPTFYLSDDTGVNQSAYLSLINTGRQFWVYSDGAWETRTATADAVSDEVAGTITLTLDANYLPNGAAVISLEDPSTYELADGDSLIWNSTTQLWEAKRPEDAIKRINDLIDVDTSTVAPITGQVLEWNGSSWVPGDGSGIVSVTSVNGQSGVVELGIRDMDDYLSEGNRLQFMYSDLLDSDLLPSGQGQWSKEDGNTLVFNDKATEGLETTVVGPTLKQLGPGDSIWLSEDTLTWTEFLLAGEPQVVGGVATRISISSPWTSEEQIVHMTLQLPSIVEPLTPSDGSVIEYDSAINKYRPGKPVARKIISLEDYYQDNPPITGDALVYNEGQKLWTPTAVETVKRYTLVQPFSLDQDGAGSDSLPLLESDSVHLIGPGIRYPMRSHIATSYNYASDFELEYPNTGDFIGDTQTHRDVPLKLVPGETYEFDASQVRWADPNINFEPSLGEEPVMVRPYITYTENGSSFNDGFKDQYWDPQTRILRWTVPQETSTDRFFLQLGTTQGGWPSCFGVWYMVPQIPVAYSEKVSTWFVLNLQAFEQDGSYEDCWSTPVNGPTNLTDKIIDYGMGNAMQGTRYGENGSGGISAYNALKRGQRLPQDVRFNPNGTPGQLELRMVEPYGGDGMSGRAEDGSLGYVGTQVYRNWGRFGEGAPFDSDFFVVHPSNMPSWRSVRLDFLNVSGGTMEFPHYLGIMMVGNVMSSYSGSLGFEP